MVASWGIGGPEQHFSSHPENWWSQLEMKTVAYLRVDPSIPGNRTISPRGTPILEKVYQDAVQVVDLNGPDLDVMLQFGSDGGLVQHGVPFLELQPSNRFDFVIIFKIFLGHKKFFELEIIFFMKFPGISTKP